MSIRASSTRPASRSSSQTMCTQPPVSRSSRTHAPCQKPKRARSVTRRLSKGKSLRFLHLTWVLSTSSKQTVCSASTSARSGMKMDRLSQSSHQTTSLCKSLSQPLLVKIWDTKQAKWTFTTGRMSALTSRGWLWSVHSKMRRLFSLWLRTLLRFQSWRTARRCSWRLYLSTRTLNPTHHQCLQIIRLKSPICLIGLAKQIAF